MPKSDAHKQVGSFVPQDMYRNTTKDYGSHGTGFSSQGALSPGGAAGADYQTTSVGDTPDADSGVPTDF